MLEQSTQATAFSTYIPSKNQQHTLWENQEFHKKSMKFLST